MTYPHVGQEEGLDLSSVQTMNGGSGKPGFHVGVVSKAEMKPQTNGSKVISLTFQTPEGLVGERITISHPKMHQQENIKQVVEIGLKKLKTLLTYAKDSTGKPFDPNRFKGAGSLLGATVGLHAEYGKPYISNTSNKEIVPVEVAQRGRPYYHVEEIPALAASYVTPAKATNTVDKEDPKKDGIPF